MLRPYLPLLSHTRGFPKIVIPDSMERATFPKPSPLGKGAKLL